MIRLSFHGAARGVTGSCHLLTTPSIRLLVDCGMFQGSRELDEENRNHFGFDPAEVDVLLLTHAHLDHCGRIPLLVKQGFRGAILCTAATRELARLVLLDAAGLQEEEARRKREQARRHGEDETAITPLYDTLDVIYAMDFFTDICRFGHPIGLAPGVEATFFDAGHILGSAFVQVRIQDSGRTATILFSGDLGYGGRAILRDPAAPPPSDAVVMETTYGDRRHKALSPSLEELYEVIDHTVSRGGKVLIPTFALERAQEVLYGLREGMERGRLSPHVPVFLDSPMAISATEIFRRHPECYDEATAAIFRDGRDPFALPNLHFTRETAQSMALNSLQGGAVIMAGSGMATGGRIRHHLKHNLYRSECAVVFVGYAAQGTLARQIIDGADTVRIFGEKVRVRASVHTIGGFSAHGDQRDLLAFHQAANPAATFLVHGEVRAMEALASRLDGGEVHMPAPHQAFEL